MLLAIIHFGKKYKNIPRAKCDCLANTGTKIPSVLFFHLVQK